jgi:phosphoserine phosphatase
MSRDEYEIQLDRSHISRGGVGVVNRIRTDGDKKAAVSGGVPTYVNAFRQRLYIERLPQAFLQRLKRQTMRIGGLVKRFRT